MPTYLYADESGHEVEAVHSMALDPLVTCKICGATMHRKPQMPMVNWGGLPPSLENNNPVIREMIDGAPKRRDEYAELKSKRKA